VDAVAPFSHLIFQQYQIAGRVIIIKKKKAFQLPLSLSLL